MENTTKAQELGITEFPYAEYNDNKQLTYKEDENGNWITIEYDEEGRITRQTSSNGGEQIIRYDAAGNEIYHETNDMITETEYDDQKRPTYQKQSEKCENGESYWFRVSYNDEENSSTFEDSRGIEGYRQFDNSDRLINENLKSQDENGNWMRKTTTYTYEEINEEPEA